MTVKVKGYGERRPIAPNAIKGKDNPAGRAKNRRVEITVTFKKPAKKQARR